LDVLAGVRPPSDGTAERARRLRVAYLPQDAPAPVASTVLGEALASRTDLAALFDEMLALEDQLQAPGPEADTALARYGECQGAFEGMGGYELESRARAVLHGLGLEETEQRRSPRELSVGQIRRLEMAKLLLQDADLLLLDEPTNHLDLTAIEWLETFLIGTPEALCIVSHDRRFLDRVCTRVIDLEAGRAELYEGSYTHYVRQRAERRTRWHKEWEAQQAHIAHQEDFIRRYRAGQRAREARGRQLKLDRLPRVPEPPDPERLRLRLQAAPSAQVVLRAEGLAVGRGARVLLEVPELLVTRGERVAIVAPNGAGKTTLLHTLAGQLPPLRGTVRPGARARLRLYRQDFSDLDSEHTVLEAILAEHPTVGPERARTVLGAFLFSGDEVDQRVGTLSGGERARVALARLSFDDANCLLLDEPTNHLDIPAQEVLEAALQQYPGAVVVVSHDRYFIDQVATTVWTLADGHLRAPQAPPEVVPPVTGTGRGPEAASGRRGARESQRPAPHRPSTASPASGAPVAVERQIAELEATVAEIEAGLQDPALYRDPPRAADLAQRHEQARRQLEGLYARWVVASGRR
ncbi:MAG TPA: ABC-F family ATP-binding cassette domain-containing protein, partial [Candidatus Dormibacteraeota bacterium]|nr:ABC-F family ATP-binding cassette domain-containing protein [Candidatus Dormibacteraeota bacterium]